MTNIAQYLFHKCCSRPSPHLHKFGPFYIVLLAVPLVMADLTRHVLVDAGIWTPADSPSPVMYRDGCDSPTMACLSVIGWIFTVFCTYTGYLLLLVATLWASGIAPRVKALFRRFCRQHVSKQAGGGCKQPGGGCKQPQASV